MLFRIDPSAPEPLFVQLSTQVRTAIADERLAAGQRLPPARDLADSLAINLHTVLRAYHALRDEGLLELRRGRGAVVSARAAQDYHPLHVAIADVVSTSRRLGIAPETTTVLLKEALRHKEDLR